MKTEQTKRCMDAPRHRSTLRPRMADACGFSFLPSFFSFTQMKKATSWGNPDTTFGGFTETPEDYQIRRLVKYTGNPATPEFNAYEEDPWEVVKKRNIRMWDGYPDKSLVPRGYKNYANYKSWEEDPVFYYKYLPPTKYYGQYIEGLFGDALLKMTQTSGWRYRNSSFTYHSGLDIVRSDGNTLGQPIYAPSDGEFWFVRNQFAFSIKLPNDDPLISGDSYRDPVYGISGVFVTNPNSIRDGRVYIFSHQGLKEGDAESELLQKFNEYYPEKNFPIQRNQSLTIPAITQKVTKGDWIGIVGTRGESTRAHIHFEAFEYFTELDGAAPGWYRIDPLTIFDQEKITKSGDCDGPNGSVIQINKEKETELTDAEKLTLFRLWARTDDFWSKK